MANSATKTDKSPSIFAELNRLIYEYLQIIGMNKTLSSFITECGQKSLPCPPKDIVSKSTFTQADSKTILNSFDIGDFDSFIDKWNLFLAHIHVTSDDMKKLEVYIRVYFSMWPRAHGRSEAEQSKAMANLKSYLENTNELSGDPTILPLFALPFVPDPQKHPVFKELFEESWTERLRFQLEATLQKYFEMLQDNIGYHSKLAAVVLKAQTGVVIEGTSDSQTTDAVIKYHQDRFAQLMTTYRKVRKTLRGTRESYGKLLKVSSELIIGLEDAAKGTLGNVQPTIEKCYRIFPELFTSETDGKGKPDKEYFKQMANSAVLNNVLDSDVSLFFIGISDLGPESLNYPEIKESLVSDKILQPEKLSLLQSLRWLLTKSSPKCREHAMECFIGADLLGLSREDSEFRVQLFACMLTPVPTYLKECFARFLNSIASIKIGRSYLAKHAYCLDILVKCLGTCKGENESYICQMVVATLQKMSLRKQMRLGMIEKDVIPWLATYLKSELSRKPNTWTADNGNPDVMYNPYLMEYGWALLMNLCLHEEAKPSSGATSSDILTSVVQMLLARPSPDIAPYVVSTLYSLLRNPDVFSMAKKIRLNDTLSEIIGNSKTEMAHHLRKLVDVLSSKGYDRITTTGEVDYDDDDNADPEEFEPELELVETWASTNEFTCSTGDDFLIQNYLIHRELVLPEMPQRKNQLQGVYNRPTTPKSITLGSPAECQLNFLPCQPLTSQDSLINRSSSSKKIPSSSKGISVKSSTFQPIGKTEPNKSISEIRSSKTLIPSYSPKATTSKTSSSLISQIEVPGKLNIPNSTPTLILKKNHPNTFESLGENDRTGNGLYNGNAILNLMKEKYQNGGTFVDSVISNAVKASTSAQLDKPDKHIAEIHFTASESQQNTPIITEEAPKVKEE